ncbi:ABC transporter ATP-binding protein [Angustibacter sp. Root456]|uniref:ABC transporter ATP-binding protein n=1 Tax=Angustibacter sp. Root456 TaxID=1736539 RepID=UPI00138F4C7C|nr:ABC transporter ATP-binding protein [Angustibacter sp. Root456]
MRLVREPGTSPAELRGVSHRYGSDRQALTDVSVQLQPGVTALVGVNGAGKSTLLSILAGSLRPTAGSVLIGGTDLNGRRRREVIGRVALMPQALTVPPNLTAWEAVAVIGWMRGLASREAARRADRALEAVDLANRRGSAIKELSGGMKRRVALAQAIVAEPDVLLLDEPSTGLDPQQRRRMVDIVKALHGTVVFSSHVMEDVVDTASRVLVLHEGGVRFDGDVDELSARAPAGAPPERRPEAAFLALIGDAEARAR